ncbi:Peroxiredoxin [Spraguea lophii 42_110]|uniref:Peroxiredoxin n=1 Tax=Spraguea lophii (strain 42_110) TaxID=1358809 RepID=S7XU25_SPRLO|nr:Peroxiredoxin [Spraguea lophii 42_110]
MLGNKLPDMELKALIKGEIEKVRFSEYEGKYLVIIMYPYDFTFVCPTEVNEISISADKFLEINTQVLYLSCDSIYSHITWSMIDRTDSGVRGVRWPMLSDYKKEFSQKMNLLDKDGHSMRATIIVNAEGIIKHISANDSMVGRNVPEILRLIKAFKYVEKCGEVCHVNWDN